MEHRETADGNFRIYEGSPTAPIYLALSEPRVVGSVFVSDDGSICGVIARESSKSEFLYDREESDFDDLDLSQAYFYELRLP